MKNIIILELLLAFLILLLGESLFDIRKEEFQGETLKIAYTKDIGDVELKRRTLWYNADRKGFHKNDRSNG